MQASNAALSCRLRLLYDDNLIRLRALGALHDVELDLISLAKALVALLLDGAVMDEKIGRIGTSDKSIALGVIEPLNCSFVLTHGSDSSLDQVAHSKDLRREVSSFVWCQTLLCYV